VLARLLNLRVYRESVGGLCQLRGAFVVVGRMNQRTLFKCISFVATVIAAVFFYWLSYEHLLLYGVVEVFVAIVVMGVTIFPAETYNLIRRIPTQSDIFIGRVTKTATMFGAVYVFVRGLNDIDKALPSFTWWDRWNWACEATRRLLNL
jgi:hypothetical protein